MTYLRSQYFSFAFSVALSLAVCFSQTAFSQDDETQTSTTAIETADVKTAFDGLLFSGRVPKTVEELKFMENHFAKLSEEVFPATVNIQLSRRLTRWLHLDGSSRDR
jgi:hypothetical protein